LVFEILNRKGLIMNGAYHIINGWEQADGSVRVWQETNDDEDRGYPTVQAQWETTCKDAEAFKRRFGVSRIGISGVEVTVSLDGNRL